MPGFQFRETMVGSYCTLDEPDRQRALRFELAGRADSIAHHLRTGEVEVSGTLSAEGLADEVAVSGRLIMKPLRRFVRYDLDFEASDGNRFHLGGQKDIQFTHPVKTTTVLPASIYDEDGNEYATCVLHFELSQLVPFVSSFRLA